MNLDDLSNILADLYRRAGNRPMKIKEMAKRLDVPSDLYRTFRDGVRDLYGGGFLVRVRKGRYQLARSVELREGRIAVRRDGSALLKPVAPGQEPVRISARDRKDAVHGDRVRVLVDEDRGRWGWTGRVVEVLERAHPMIGGVLVRSRGHCLVRPANPRIDRDVVVVGGPGEAKEGDTVAVEILDWGRGGRRIQGTITRVFGDPSTHDPGIVSIILENGLPFDFPTEVLEAARSIAEEAREDDLPGRLDRRDLPLFTIDPADAHDYDDGLSLERIGRGRWRVGIHIADVSHFVRPGSPVDLEARRRGTSVYLVDRAIPMLPERLSGEVCSLLPGEQRPAVSVFVDIGRDGTIHGTKISETVVRSRARLTYDRAQRILEGGDDPEAGAFREDLRRLHALSRELHRARAERGSLDFDRPEPRVILDDEGVPVEVHRVDPLDSHRLIEEFMVLANRIVTEALTGAGVPLIYRVHEAPSAEDLEPLERCLAGLGRTPPWRASGISPGALQQVLDGCRSRGEKHLLSHLVLRSMKRALYSGRNRGHFGLAVPLYAHFTSPIRRYPDLFVHRQLKAHLRGQRPPVPEAEEGLLEEIAVHAVERERAADRAEWDSVDLKIVQFMENRLGEVFPGMVSGFASAGFFVLLDAFPVEGMVLLRDLEDDFYEFIDEEWRLRGRRTGRTFSLGDRVRIEVARADRFRREIDFRLLDHRPG
jgi:ribonuclease R